MEEQQQKSASSSSALEDDPLSWTAPPPQTRTQVREEHGPNRGRFTVSGQNEDGMGVIELLSSRVNILQWWKEEGL